MMSPPPSAPPDPRPKLIPGRSDSTQTLPVLFAGGVCVTVVCVFACYALYGYVYENFHHTPVPAYIDTLFYVLIDVPLAYFFGVFLYWVISDRRGARRYSDAARFIIFTPFLFVACAGTSMSVRALYGSSGPGYVLVMFGIPTLYVFAVLMLGSFPWFKKPAEPRAFGAFLNEFSRQSNELTGSVKGKSAEAVHTSSHRGAVSVCTKCGLVTSGNEKTCHSCGAPMTATPPTHQ